MATYVRKTCFDCRFLQKALKQKVVGGGGISYQESHLVASPKNQYLEHELTPQSSMNCFPHPIRSVLSDVFGFPFLASMGAKMAFFGATACGEGEPPSRP